MSINTLEAFIERRRVRRRPEHVKGQVIIGAPATRKRDVTVVRTLFRYLVERGHIARNPALLLSTPTVRNLNPRAIDDDTWTAVWRHPVLSDVERVAIGLGYFCGLRRAEIVSLTPSNVDLSNLRLVNFGRKGGAEGSFAYGSALLLHEQRLPQVLSGAEMLTAPLERLVAARSDRPYLVSWGDERPQRAGLKDPYPEGWTPPNTFNKG